MTFTGYLTDGTTALRRDVYVTVDPRRLQILDEQGRLVDEWPLDGLRLAEEVYRGQPVRLVHRDRGEACLTFEAHDILEQLGKRLPRLRRRHLARSSTLSRMALWGLAVIALVGALILGVPYLAGPLARAIPMEWEEAMGSTIAESMAEKSTFCADTAGQASLDALVERLAAATKTPYQFKVRISAHSDVNAFAAPGGYIVLFNGLIQSAQSPEEVAGVLAHEMAHTVKRHPTEGLIHALGIRLVIGLVIGDASALTSGLAEVGENLIILSYNRDKEAEADRVGVEMLNRAGIRSDGLIAFFQQLQEKGKGAPPAALAFLSTHPLHEQRIDAIKPLVRRHGPALTRAQWRSLRNICS